MGLLVIVEPVGEPVTVAELATQLGLPNFTDPTLASQRDAQLAGYITVARQWCEVYTQRRFLRQTMRLLMDFFPGYVDFKLAGQRVSSPFVSGSNAVLVGIRYAIALPYPKVIGVTGFSYQDQNGDLVAMVAGTDYEEDVASQPARLTPLFGQMWPVARVIINAVQVDYVTGYGGTVTVSVAAGQTALTGYQFIDGDVGAKICIPGAGAAGATLVTTIASVDGSGNAALASPAVDAVVNASAYVGSPVPEPIKMAIKFLAQFLFEQGSVVDMPLPTVIKALLGPYRDLRL